MRKIGIRAEGWRHVRAWRLLVVLVTLYALALNGTLGAAAAAANPPHVGVICQQLLAGDEAAQAGTSAPVEHRHTSPCCTPAAMAVDAVLPSLVASHLTWPRQRSLGPAWTLAQTGRIRAPPRHAAHPRAPPSLESIA